MSTWLPAPARQWIDRLGWEKLLFSGFVLALMSGGAYWQLRGNMLALLPALGLLALVTVLLDWRVVMYALLASLAFSHEFHLPGGLALDFPSEPLMLLVLGAVVLTLLLKRSTLTAAELTHPLLVLLALQLLWAGASTLTSVAPVKSVKFLLAKLWYLGPFVLGGLLLMRRPGQLWPLVSLYVGAVVVTVLYAIRRHAGTGFSFDTVHDSLQPFYYNHVTYATVLALLLPYTLYGARVATHWRTRRLWRVALVVLAVGLLLSYTRASFLSIPAAAGFYLVVRWRQTRLFLLGVSLAAATAVGYFAYQSNFMRYAPEFEQTVYNGHNFEKHLEATYELKDVSGMERVYRWLAAAHMVARKPWLGSGPSTFYPEYQRYTVRSFRTYVSDNPERSTTHNYFLLLLAEQGIPGFLLFGLLAGTALLLVERLYHRRPEPAHRALVLAVGLSLFIILFHLLLNELLEVDKIGSFFFLGLAALIRLDVTTRTRAPAAPLT